MNAHRIESAGPARRSVLVWFAVFGGVAAWTAHLLFFVSMVQYTCNVGGDVWVLHLVTALTAAATIAAIALSANLLRIARDNGRGADDDRDTPDARLRFLGGLGVLVGAINLLLILAEGSLVPFLRRCGG